MSAVLSVITPGNIPHPPFPYADMKAARAAIEKAISTGLLRIEEHGVVIMTGPGTLYKAVSLDWEDPPDNPPEPVYLTLQTPHGAQLPPFGFATEAAADNAIRTLAARGYAWFPGRPEDKEVTYVQSTPGMVAMIQSKEAFEARLKAAREAEAVRQQTTFVKPDEPPTSPPSRIIL